MTAPLTTRRHYSNGSPQATLNTGINASATTFLLSTATGWPALPFPLILDYEGASEEVVLVKAMSGATVTDCTRGFDGEAAQSHSVGAVCVHGVIAKDAEEGSLHTSSAAAHGATSPLVGKDDAVTITNKTISSSTHQATATDPAVRAKAAATGSAPVVLVTDSTGSTTLFQVPKTGAIGLIAAAVTGALTAASAAISGAMSAASATISGLLTAGSATITGALSAGSVSTSGAVSAASVTATGVIGSLGHNPSILVGFAESTTAQGTVALGVEAKDAGVGDVAFTAIAGHRYRVKYSARMSSATANSSGDFRIRDGGAGSPSNASNQLTAASSGTMVPGGADSRQVTAEAIITGLTAGTHTIAGFVTCTAGSLVKAEQASGQTRQLCVWDEGV
jgi:hypothetical protein